MTGDLHLPLVTPTRADALLEAIIHDQVVACIDLAALAAVQQALAALVEEVHGEGQDRAAQVSLALIDQSLGRLASEFAAYLRLDNTLRRRGCRMCEDEVRSARAARAPGMAASPGSVDRPGGDPSSSSSGSDLRPGPGADPGRTG